MCDFHSILGVDIGDTYEIRHDSSNSHAGMAYADHGDDP